MKDADPNYFFGPITFNSIILWLLSFATIIFILDVIGLLPPRFAKYLARNRYETVIMALQRMGVKISIEETEKKRTIVQRASEALGLSEPDYKVLLRQLLSEDTFDSKVGIGNSRHFTSDKFIDVMGASTSQERCLTYAKVLNTHFDSSGFDVIATPKSGSPILGYEFSRLIGKPFVLGAHMKVTDSQGIVGEHNYLDFPKSLTLTRKKILLVDDSTTGGRKMVELAQKLREAGAEVRTALVLFEPKGKGAREKLSTQGIELVSLTEGPTGRM
jgi:orotate phosphoribosyltransferase